MTSLEGWVVGVYLAIGVFWFWRAARRLRPSKFMPPITGRRAMLMWIDLILFVPLWLIFIVHLGVREMWDEVG